MKNILNKILFALLLVAGTIPYVGALPTAESAVPTVTDGPYIKHDNGGYMVMEVIDSIPQWKNMEGNGPFTVTSSDGKHSFEVTLREVTVPAWDYDMPRRMTVLSDPHGSLDAYVSILTSAGIIDGNYNWAYGDGHLFLLGDIFDRGAEVLPIFWLTYKMQVEAEQAGGLVHFTWGNHEDMVLYNDMRYAFEKYEELAAKLDLRYSDLWTPDWVLGEWIATRNIIERVGDYLFVHAGISPELLERDWDIPEINDIMRRHLYFDRNSRKEIPDVDFLFRSSGPIWYRGMVRPEEYGPIDNEDVTRILERYGVKGIFVGHTIFDEVSSFFDGRVIDVNVSNVKNMEQGLSRGVQIDDGQLYLIYDDPGARRLWDPVTTTNRE